MGQMTQQQIREEVEFWSQVVKNRHERGVDAKFEKSVLDELQSKQTKTTKSSGGYLPTVDLWDADTQHAVVSGDLKLRRGQWVKCGDNTLSRFVCVHGGGLWVVHPEGDPEGKRRITTKRFSEICDAASGRDLAKRIKNRKGNK